MPHNRFYSPTNIIEGSELHHLSHVMRNTQGDIIELVDGKGALHIAKIDTITKKAAHLTIKETTIAPLPAFQKTLIQGLPKTPNKLKLILEKGTELGIDAFHFFGSKTPSHEKLHTILISALKQCGRLHLPSLAFHTHLQDIPLSPSYYGDPQGNPLEPGRHVFVIGPESGFTPDEITHLKGQKARPTKLSKHILRTETAAIVASHLLSTT